MLSVMCDGRVFAERSGPAEASGAASGEESGRIEVVAFPGWARTRADFAACLGGFPALAFDLPGFGLSPEPPGAWGSEDYARFMAEVIAGIGTPQVVVGHSFGGRIALVLAATRPDLVRGLVLSGVPLGRRAADRPRSPLGFRAARWAHRRHLVPDAAMARARQRYGSTDYRNSSGVMRDILVRSVNESYDDYLDKIAAPARLVWGENDTAAPVDGARRAVSAMPNARLDVVAGAGHMLPLTHPEPLKASIAELLGGAER